jgi:hypothetical protein
MASALALVGKIAFVVGVVIAIIGGIWGGDVLPEKDWVIWILLIAGILIGLLNVTAKEAGVVLTAAVALIVISIWGLAGGFGPVADVNQSLANETQGIVYCFGLLMAPAAIIVAIKAVISTAKPGD